MSIVIAGGTKGIGLEIAAHFAARKETLVLAYARDDAAAAVAKTRCEGLGARVRTVRADLASEEGLRAIDAAAEGEPVRVLVHSAVDPLAGPLLAHDPKALSHALDVGGLSLLSLVRTLLPRLERGSSVVYLSSRGGRTVIPGYAAVGVAKALAESLLRYLAVELAPRGIRINAVAPSIVDTEAVRAMFGAGAEGALRHAAESNPSGRGILPEDYVGVVDFLTQPASAFVQGQVVFVNGGANLMA